MGGVLGQVPTGGVTAIRVGPITHRVHTWEPAHWRKPPVTPRPARMSVQGPQFWEPEVWLSRLSSYRQVAITQSTKSHDFCIFCCFLLVLLLLTVLLGVELRCCLLAPSPAAVMCLAQKCVRRPSVPCW